MKQAGCLRAFAGSKPLHPNDLPSTSKSSFNPGRLTDSLEVLPGIGPATAAEAAKLGLATLGDLLFHFPHRHEDYTSLKEIADLKWADDATVLVTVKQPPVLQPTRRRGLRIVKAAVGDESGYMTAVWFNQGYLAGRLKPGDELFLRGSYDGGSNSFQVKSHELLSQGHAGLHTTGFVPVYHTTANISVKRLRTWLAEVRPLAARMADPLPATLLEKLNLPRRADAVDSMHFPADIEAYALAEKRMIFEELFLMQTGLLTHRQLYMKKRRGTVLSSAGRLTADFIHQLPFSLTSDQDRVCAEISADLGQAAPMQRLLQGDVGSGKTVVAVYAMLRAVEHGYQAALMAPTEVLSEQHYLRLSSMLAGLDVTTAFFSSRLKAARRKEMLEELATGQIDLAIGTHALIQKDIVFRRLAIVVVDEQHRFGVRQRDELASKATRAGLTPHVLHMTATPIPRTLALTLYGDLDVSVIREAPAGRAPVITRLVAESQRAQAYDFIRGQLDAGRQCFIVCPLIEESEKLQAKAVEAEFLRLVETDLRGYSLEMLHGQLETAEKQRVMKAFAGGTAQVLVTTTVIEVGVDVPNATVMVIEAAERFGLAQLHQLRGRVGRAGHKSYCLLFGDPHTSQGRRRLEAIEKNRDGFLLADLDLEIRGEGQILGARQSGLPDLKLARLTRDREVIESARSFARMLLRDDPLLRSPKHSLMRGEIEQLFGDTLAWMRRI